MAEVRRGHQDHHPQGLKRQNSRKDPPLHNLRELTVLSGNAGCSKAEIQAINPEPSLPILSVFQLRR